ncbi:MAG: hypothetical protein WBW84_12625 [Acidobacteriaceae bacterium]
MFRKLAGSGVVMALVVAAGCATSFAKDKTENQSPVAWGNLSGNSGCVIFKESQETDSKMMPGGGGFTTETVKTLEVVDAIHAILPRKKYKETKEDLGTLLNLSVANHWKYVKIPKKYSPEELEKAKVMCGVR